MLCLKTSALFRAFSLFVLNRRRYICCVELIRYLSRRQSFYFPFENLLHHGRCFGIDDQLILVIRRSHISEYNTGADKLTAPTLGFKITPDLDRNIAAVRIVHQIFEGQDQLVIRCTRLGVVIMVIDRYETNAKARKYLLDILTRSDILTTKTRKVFDHDAVNFSGSNRIHHFVEIRTLKVCAGKAVIAVFFNYCDFRVLLEIIHDQQPLIGNAVTLKFFAGNRKVAIFL